MVKWFDDPKDYLQRSSSTYKLEEPRGSYNETTGISCGIFWLCPKKVEMD
ncbi:MAG: hypothetical protein GW780_05020 [Candidatus Aenigmarchaeota archaeon]|nr:hypothetical protein [Candidatus Aenigmarchaeota archaeon]NCS71492.1 hypothetical protein [Candidatus Aenigmarchaeota archaeon]